MRKLLHPSKATISRHDLAAAHSNFCIVLRALGDLPGSVESDPTQLAYSGDGKRELFFVGCLRDLTFIPEGIDLRDDVARAMSEPWRHPTDLAQFAANLIKRSGVIGSLSRQIAATWSSVPALHELFSSTELAEICSDRLLRCLLQSSLVFDLELERFLTVVRRMILIAALGGIGPQAFEQGNLRFVCAWRSSASLTSTSFPGQMKKNRKRRDYGLDWSRRWQPERPFRSRGS